MSSQEVLSEMVNRLKTQGGFTLDRTGQFVKDGYAVSIDPGDTMVVDEVTDATMAEFILSRWETIRQDGKVIGGWLDTETGKTHLDVITIYTDRDKAIADGRFYGELAIFDLSAGEEIRLSYEVGDEDPYPLERDDPNDEDPGCDAEDTFQCTMRFNHNSPHVGGNGRVILGVWDK